MTVPNRDKPWLIRTYAGHSTAAKSNELYRTNLARGQTGLSRRLRSADPDRLRLRPSRWPRARSARSACRSAISATCARCSTASRSTAMNTSMTINAPAAWLLSLYIAAGEAQGVGASKLQGTTQNDIIKEYLSRGTYIFPPEPSLQADGRHDRLHLSRGSQVEPDERLQLSPAGSGRDAGAGAGLRAGQRHRRARRGAGARPGARGGLPAGGGPHLVLRQCRHPLRHRDVQDAGLRRAVGRHHARTATASPTPSSGCSATACR